jgi:quercetin dioxygenase-like cupin family protein
MKVTLLKPAFTDRRGAILDILTHVSVDAVTIITCKKGSVRGNHYHKKTVQYTYVVSGRIKYLTGKPGKKAKTRTLKAGHLVFSPAGETHAFEALSDSVILSLSSGPRKGFDYEKDVFRLPTPLR